MGNRLHFHPIFYCLIFENCLVSISSSWSCITSIGANLEAGVSKPQRFHPTHFIHIKLLHQQLEYSNEKKTSIYLTTRPIHSLPLSAMFNDLNVQQQQE